MRLEDDVAWLWEEWADSNNMYLKVKELSLVMCYIDKTHTILWKNI